MKDNLLRRISRAACVTLLAVMSALAQEHTWAGRTLDNLEWAIHESLAVLPSYSVFDTIRFEAQGKNITLSGQVTSDRIRESAERAVKQVSGVEGVVNQIEVLPSSRRDDVLRMKVYRAVYETKPLEKYGTRSTPPIHIIVKDGWVTLEGVVDSDADRSMVHQRALKVSSHVSDNLRVAPAES